MAAFTDSESFLLIQIYGQPEFQVKFKDFKKNHQLIWRDIAAQLQILGAGQFPSRTHQQCKDRIGNLKKKYYALKREKRSGDSPPDWIFWEELNAILGPRPTANPQTLFDSLDSASSSTNIETSPEDSLLDGDCNDSSSASRNKRFKPTPSSFRRTKMKNNDESSQVLSFLQKMQENEQQYLQKQEERDSKFLNILGDLSKAVNKIADATAVGYEANPGSSEPSADVQYYFLQGGDQA